MADGFNLTTVCSAGSITAHYRVEGNRWLRMAHCPCGWHGYVNQLGLCKKCGAQLAWAPLLGTK